MGGSDRRSWPVVPGYEVLRLIGRGGFGTVYEARQESVDRNVAIKVLSGTGVEADTERRFRAEAKAIGSLSWHNHVVSLFDAGTTPDGALYLVMELVPGAALSDQIRAGAVFDPAAITRIGIEMADALEAAHDVGVLHRDIKPDNILMGRHADYLLSDFGIASLDDGTRSATGSFTGTYAYSAPELLRGERATVRSDVYSLGATLYTLAAGRPAFTSNIDSTPAAVVLRIVTEPAPPLPSSVPAGLAAIIGVAMAKDPAERYASAGDLKHALEGQSIGQSSPNSSVRPRPVLARPTDIGPGAKDLDATTVARDRGTSALTPDIREVPTGTVDPDLAPTVHPAAPADPPPPPPAALPSPPVPAEPSDVSTGASEPTPPARPRRSRTTAKAVVALLVVVLIGAALAANRSKTNEPTSANGDRVQSVPGGTGAVANPAALPSDGDGCGTLAFDPEARRGGTFTTRAALTAQVADATFDPAGADTRDMLQVTSALWDGLTDLDYTALCAPKLRGAVAESWSSNTDATEFTFKIRKDARFSDGTPVLPSSFKAGWERAGSKDIDAHFGSLLDLLKDGWKLRTGSVATLPSIVADDRARTLTITLEHPMADFPSVVSNPVFSPVNAADLARIGTSTGWGDKGLTIGNGPFKLESVTPDEVVLVPNQHWIGNVYGDEQVFLDRLVFQAPPEATLTFYSPLVALENGTVNSSFIPAGQSAAALKAHPNNTFGMPATVSAFLAFGSDDPELSGRGNLDLRRAISLAIDRSRINDEGYAGAMKVSTGVTPPGIAGYDAGLCDYCAYDPEAARAHLDRWRNDGGVLTSPIRVNVKDPERPDATNRIIKENLEEDLGLSVEYVKIPDSPPLAAGQPGECGICGLGWSADHPTYDNFIELFSRSAIGRYNLARFDDPVFEQVVAAARSELDADRRADLYHRAEDILLNQHTVAIPLLTGDPPIVLGDDVRNFGPQPSGYVPWERVSVGN